MKTTMIATGILALMLAVAPVSAPKSAWAQDASFSAAQKAELGKVIQEYLLENPKVIIDAVEKYRANQEEIENKAAEAAIKTKGKALYEEPTSPVAGNPKGDVVMVEFFDYNCGYCKVAFKDVQALVKDDKNLKVVFKDIPILSESSHSAARYALAADKQGKYWEYHAALMNHQGALNDAELEKIGTAIKLDIAKLKTDAESNEVKSIIEKNLALARELGITGTPGFVINDQLLRGHYGIDALRKIISDSRAAKTAKE